MREIPVGELRTANHLLNDFEKLSALYQEEGYLFFRNVLDESAVLRARQEFVRVLQQQGVAQRKLRGGDVQQRRVHFEYRAVHVARIGPVR